MAEVVLHIVTSFMMRIGLQLISYNLLPTTFATLPPAYYAHLAAFRARFYLGGTDLRQYSSKANVAVTGHGSPWVGTQRTAPLPALKENIKKAMFYC